MVLFVVGICVFAFGASLYMTAALGTAPYDALAPMIVDASGAKYRVVRTAQDVVFLILAVVFHGAIGVGTIVTAFFTGPLIEFFTQRVSTPLMASVLPPAAAGGRRRAGDDGGRRGRDHGRRGLRRRRRRLQRARELTLTGY